MLVLQTCNLFSRGLELADSTLTKSKQNENNETLSNDEANSIGDLNNTFNAIKGEIGKVIIGQEEAIEKCLLDCSRKVTLC